LQRYYHHVPIEIIQKDPTAQFEAERTLPIIIIKGFLTFNFPRLYFIVLY